MDLGLVPYEDACYKECMRNHAASMGGHAFDGCGEFMPTKLDRLKCAACGCHRNFHRRSEFHGHAGTVLLYGSPKPAPHHFPAVFAAPVPSSLPLPYHAVPPVPLQAVQGNRQGSETPPPMPEEGSGGPGGSGPVGRKRYRTKFSAEQKEKMRVFAERLGWRIQKHDDVALEHFCVEVGVKPQVLKVWMHNNKSHFSAEKGAGVDSVDNSSSGAGAPAAASPIEV